MCELAQGCSPLLLPLAARRCCCLELAAAAARRSAAAAEASALGAGAVGVGGCAQLRAAALVGDRYAIRFLGAAACEEAAAFESLPVLLATWIFAPPQAGEKDERRFEKRNLCSRVPRLRFHVAVFCCRRSCVSACSTASQSSLMRSVSPSISSSEHQEKTCEDITPH